MSPLNLPFAFFLSGAAALLFEVLWFRALGRIVGNTVWTGALVLTAFMLGMALGGVLVARASKWVRRPARAFALAEATVAVFGTLLVFGLPRVEAMAAGLLEPWVDSPGLLVGVRLTLSLVAMLIPTTAMGMTLALGVRLVAHKETARGLGILYAANTFGACVAPMIGEYHLIGALGLRGTALVAACLNLGAAAMAQFVPSSGASPAPATPRRPSRSPRRLLAAAAIAGALALGLEVIWFRLLILYSPSTDSAFALMLSVVLLGIALGGAAAPLAARVGFAWTAGGTALAVVLGYLLTTPRFIPGLPDLLPYALMLMLPATFVSGSLFTLLGAEIRGDAENPQAAIGSLMSANTLGAALGSAVAALVLLPTLGIEWSLFVFAASYSVLPALLIERRALLKTSLPVLLSLAALALFPFGRIETHLAAAARPYLERTHASVARVIEGPTMTLQVLHTDRFGEPVSWRLLTDSYSMTAIDRKASRYMQFFAWLPLSLHPEPKRALLISYGAGNTAQALLSDPDLARLTVVDVSPEILATSPLLHPDADPLADSRVRVVREDGRQFLRTRGEQFDIVTSEPPPPMMAGVVNLYTREYFSMIFGRLAPGGLASYWLPVNHFDPEGARAVIAAFCQAFSDCTLWVGSNYDWVLMGGRDFHHQADASRFSRLWHEPGAAALLSANGFEVPAQLGATFVADAQQLRTWVKGTPEVADDWPKRMRADPAAVRDLSEYEQWSEPGGSRERFRASSWIAAHWPPQLVEQTPSYFAWEPLFRSRHVFDRVTVVPEIDAILRQTELRTPVLWMLGSEATEQSIIDRRLASDRGDRSSHPEFAFPLGVRALSERNFALAGELLAQAADIDPQGAGALAAYAFCRAGKPAQARAVKASTLLVPELRCWQER